MRQRDDANLLLQFDENQPKGKSRQYSPTHHQPLRQGVCWQIQELREESWSLDDPAHDGFDVLKQRISATRLSLFVPRDSQDQLCVGLQLKRSWLHLERSFSRALA